MMLGKWWFNIDFLHINAMLLSGKERNAIRVYLRLSWHPVNDDPNIALIAPGLLSFCHYGSYSNIFHSHEPIPPTHR